MNGYMYIYNIGWVCVCGGGGGSAFMGGAKCVFAHMCESVCVCVCECVYGAFCLCLCVWVHACACVCVFGVKYFFIPLKEK